MSSDTASSSFSGRYEECCIRSVVLSAHLPNDDLTETASSIRQSVLYGVEGMEETPVPMAIIGVQHLFSDSIPWADRCALLLLYTPFDEGLP